MPIRAVLLDLDETLIVEEAAVAGTLEALARRVPASYGVEPAALEATVRRVARERWRAGPAAAWGRAIGISSWEGLGGRFEGPGDDLARLRAFAPGFRVGAWRDALAEHGVREEALAHALAEAYAGELLPRRTAYPDSEAVLRALHATHRLGLVTNGASDLQREKLQHSGLARWLHAVVVSGDVGIGKPDPAPFRRALELLGARAEEAVMVGDTPERDVLGARAAGVRAVWLDRHGRALPEGFEPPERITSLADLPALLAS
jgi:putative hydrolase of the HAD superfamily